MKSAGAIPTAILTVVSALALGIFAGCENNSDVDSNNSSTNMPVFVLSPAGVTLGPTTNDVILEAVGGHPPFTWTVSDNSLGTISGDNGTARVVNYKRTPATVGANVVEARDDWGWTASTVIIQE